MACAQRRTHRAFLTIAVISLIWAAGCGAGLPAMSSDGVVQRWLVLKPIPISTADGKTPDQTAQKEAFGRDWLEAVGGEAGIQPRAGTKLTIDGHTLQWQPAQTPTGLVNLQKPGQPPVEYAVAYAWAEIEQPESRKAFLGIGSDDAVKVWLNGKLVHENWSARGARLDDDLVPVELERGMNRLLLKVQNGAAAWELGCRVISTEEAEVIRAVNREVGFLADGDAAKYGDCCYAAGPDEAHRLEATAGMFASMAGLRKAFDEAYSPGKLAEFGFRYIPARIKLPPRTRIEIFGDQAKLYPAGWSELVLVKRAEGWKEIVIPWPELAARAAKQGEPLLPLEMTLANLRRMSQVFDEVAAGVRAGSYLSAADAFGVLNARLQGQMSTTAAMPLAMSANLIVPATQPAVCPVPIVELSGDGAAIGKSYGAQLGEEVRLLQREYLDQVLKMAGTGLKGYIVREALFGRAMEFKAKLSREYRAEIEAMSKTTGMDPRKALLVHCFVELIGGEACSTISVPASASTDGVARFGRNMDYLSLGVLDRRSVLLVVHPKDGYAFASVTWPGLVGVTTGINEHGLCLGCMSVNGQGFRKPRAMPNMLLYRCVLEQCKTVDEAIAFLEKTPRQTPHTLMLMDASGNRAVTELTPEKVAVRRAPETAALVSTNHHRGTDLDSPGRCARFDYLHDAGKRMFGQFSAAGVEELLTGAAQGDATLQSMVFEPANRVLYLAVGAGAPNHGFYRIDLKPYFQHEQ